MIVEKFREIPEYFCFNITNRCNLNCHYCLASANKHLAEEPDLKEIIDVLEQAEKMGSFKSNKVEEILIEGGEILILLFIEDLLKELKKFSFKIHVITNGVLIDDRFASLLSELNGDVGISLDGPTFEKNRFRFNSNKTYRKVINGIRTLVEAGVKTYINCTITKNNVDDFPKMVDFANSLGVKGIVLQQLHCVGNTSPEFFKENFLSYPQEIRINELLKSLPKNYPNLELVNSEVTFFSDIPKRYQKVCDPKISYKPMRLFRCGAGIDYFCIQPNMDLIPCGALPGFICGNLRNISLEEAWKHSEGFRFLRKFAEGRVNQIKGCTNCKYNPTCDGGCRSDMFNITGNWYDKHICCPHNSNI